LDPRRPVRMLALPLALGLVALGADNPDPTQMPDYPHGAFRGDCRQCHSSEAWSPAVIGPDFDHAKFGWELLGAHANAPCLLCHLDLEFATTTGASCADCHDDVHFGELGLDCAQCHSTRSFIDRADDVRSHRFTQFPLLGAHATVDCADCHGVAGSRFAGFTNTPTECVACHRADFEATTSPPHVEAGFPTDCLECHADQTWGGSVFDHALTGFPLTGMHRTLACVDCHTDYVFQAMSADCIACHQEDYVGTTDPPHQDSGFPPTCAACHSTDAWRPAEFNHDATGFPLTGAHVPLSCSDCHTAGLEVSADCYSCHATQFNATTDPDHLAGGFPTDCLLCHSTMGWLPATFDHNLSRFPLTGAHVMVDCAECHVGGQYTGTPTDCYACHRIDYEQTTDPDHADSGIPTSCEACHSTSTWEGAEINHDFPIYQGTHRQSRWETCDRCHENPSNYHDFTCFRCHPHDDQGETGRQHNEVGSYSYQSSRCYDCHPDGRVHDD
jgi:hypothetical protein